MQQRTRNETHADSVQHKHVQTF